MAITPRQTSTPGGGTGTAIASSFSGACQAGNGIVVTLTYGANNLTGVTDNIGNSYSIVRTANNSGANLSVIAFCANPTAGVTSVTANFSPSTTCDHVVATEVYGQLTVNAGNTRTANLQTQTANAITTTVANTIVFITVRTSNNPTLPSGFTNLANAITYRSSYIVQTAIQTGYAPSWTVGVSSPMAACVEAFTSTNTTGPGVSVSLSDTLTWTGTEKATGRDMPALADTLTWTDTHAATGRDVKLADTLSWADTQVASGHDTANADSVTWTGTFAATGRDVTLADTLTFTDAPAATGRDAAVSDTLTWTDTPAVTGRDVPPVDDTLTWDGSFAGLPQPLGHTDDTLTWVGAFSGRPDPSVLAVDRLSWGDGFSTEPDLHQTLGWSDIFWTPDDVGPRHVLLGDTVTWRFDFDVPIRTADALGWSDAFTVQNPVVGWTDTLYWRETTRADVNLLAVGRYRR